MQLVELVRVVRTSRSIYISSDDQGGDIAATAMAESLEERESRLSAQQAAMLEQMISEKLTAISNR